MGELLINTALIALIYTYFGYPLLLMVWTIAKPIRHATRVGHSPTPPKTLPAALSVIIAACNSESHIEAKINNTLAAVALAGCPVQVIVCSDGSTDRTDEIVRSYAQAGVELVRLEPRAGKERAQIKAVAAATGDVILFTDARTVLEAPALRNLRSYFSNPAIGGISSVDVVPMSGEGLYVRYEMWLRQHESHANSLVGLSGSCFATRRALAKYIEADVPSDFCLMLQGQRLGLKGISAPDVRCSYGVTQSASKEFQRKVRTVLRGLTTLSRHRDLLNINQFGFFAVQLISHKLCRWLAPLFMLMLLLGALLTFNDCWFSTAIIFGAALTLTLAALGAVIPSLAEQLWVRVPTFFLVSNSAILTAWYYLLSGKKMETWEPSKA